MGVNGIEGVGRGVSGEVAPAKGEGAAAKAEGAVPDKPVEEEAPRDTFSADDSALEDDEAGGGCTGESLDVDVESLDPGSVVDLSAGAVEGETLNLDVSDGGESKRTVQDTLVARETRQREEEKSADQARTRRDELTDAHDGIVDVEARNQRAERAIDGQRDAQYAIVDRAVSVRHDLTMRRGTASAAGVAARAPMLEQQSRTTEQDALQRIDELDRYKVSTQMNLRNAEVQLRQNARVQAQARENERQHVANGRAAYEQTQALRQLAWQLGSDPSREDRDASGLAQTVEGEAAASGEQPAAGRGRRRDAHVADAVAVDGDGDAGAGRPGAVDDRDEGTDDGAGQRLYGPAVRMQGDRNRLVLDLSRLERPRVDVTA